MSSILRIWIHTCLPGVNAAMESTAGDENLYFDCPFWRTYTDGRVDRLTGTETVAAGTDDATGVISKDAVIDPGTGVYARVYLPDGLMPGEKLPLLVYFHGGGFVIDSPASPMYHRFLNTLTAAARAVAVSVGYRLAPEHPLPAAYDDSWAALNWALSRQDPWIAGHADATRVFLAGDSVGANIAHNIAMRIGVDGLQHVAGTVILHHGFAGKDESPEYRRLIECLWRFAWGFADGVGVDDPRMNPMAPAAPRLSALGCRKLLVCAGEKEHGAPAARKYLEAVAASGWHGKAEWFESAGEDHIFFVRNPESSETQKLVRRLVSFLTDDGDGEVAGE